VEGAAALGLPQADNPTAAALSYVYLDHMAIRDERGSEQRRRRVVETAQQLRRLADEIEAAEALPALPLAAVTAEEPIKPVTVVLAVTKPDEGQPEPGV